jgi:hypothetical protein
MQTTPRMKEVASIKGDRKLQRDINKLSAPPCLLTPSPNAFLYLTAMSTKIQLHARIYWKLVFEYNNLDNAGEPTASRSSACPLTSSSFLGTITQKYHLKTHTSSSRSSFAETASREATATNQKAGVSADVSVSYGIASANVSSSYEWSKEVNDLLEKTVRSTSEQTEVKEQTFERTCQLWSVGSF